MSVIVIVIVMNEKNVVSVIVMNERSECYCYCYSLPLTPFVSLSLSLSLSLGDHPLGSTSFLKYLGDDKMQEFLNFCMGCHSF